MANSTSSTGGIGFVGALTILFIGLKLGKVIDWSWWWVLSPLWIGFAVFLVLLVVIAVIALCVGRRPTYRYRRSSKHHW